jgi:hypothetical protein
VDYLGKYLAQTFVLQPPDSWKTNGEYQIRDPHPGDYSGVTFAIHVMRVKEVDLHSCCCKLKRADMHTNIYTTLFPARSPNLVLSLYHEGVHAWADYYAGQYAFAVWVKDHTENCTTLGNEAVQGLAPIGVTVQIPPTERDCKDALQASLDKLRDRLDALEFGIMQTQAHKLIGNPGTTEPGERKFVDWFNSWLPTVFPSPPSRPPLAFD